MAIKEITDVLEELVIFTRNQIVDPNNRTSRATDQFTGDGTTTTFTLANTAVKNVRTVTVAGTEKDFGNEYTVSYSEAITTITIPTAPTNGQLILIVYDFGAHWIYDDLPNGHLSLGNYPRITVRIARMGTEDIGLGGGSLQSNMEIEWIVFTDAQKQALDLLIDIKNALMDNQKSFYTFEFISPREIRGTEASPNRAEEVVQASLRADIPNVFET